MPLHSLMFGWEYPPLHLGGLGVACQGLVQGLLSNGIQVTLVLPHPLTTKTEDVDVISPTENVLHSVQVKSFLSPYDGVSDYALRMSKVPSELHQMYGADLPEAVMHFTDMSVEMTKDVHPDVVHCHDWMTYGAGLRSATYHRAPLITHIHATELDRTNFHPNEWIYRLERAGFEAANKIIAVSNYTKSILTQHYGIAPDKISVVHNGTHREYEQASHLPRAELMKKRNPMVLFLGRLTIQKGPVQFLEMAAHIHKIRPDVLFVVAGEGNMLSEIIDQACKLNLQDCTLFTGKVTTQEAHELYRSADCFVMPSLSEPFGLVALEALSHGTPVIISKQSGVSEVMRHGFAVDFWDTEKMADCVLTILRDEPLAQQLTSEAPLSLQHLTWQNQARQVYSIYKHLITQKR